MTKQEFARRSMEIVEICIEKNIHYELDLDSNDYKSYLIVSYPFNISVFEVDKNINNNWFLHLRKIIKESTE